MQTIAIDFDGVIHKYSKGWQDGSCYDKEVDGVFEAIDLLMTKYTVFIFSTRNSRQIKKWLQERIMECGFGDNPNDPSDWRSPKYTFTCERIPFWVKFWNKKNVLGITKRKLPALVYIDDRAINFQGDWKQTLAEIREFKTYQQ